MTDVEYQSAILEEYRSLRTEIMGLQKQWPMILAFTIAAIATLIGLYENRILINGNNLDKDPIFSIITVSLLMYIIIIPSVILQIRSQIAIQRIGSYIRKFIEPQVDGLNWETEFFKRNKLVERRARRKGLQSYGKFYLFLSLLPLIYTVNISYKHSISLLSCPNIPWFLTIFLIGGYSIYLSMDLWHALSKQWSRAEWEGE